MFFDCGIWCLAEVSSVKPYVGADSKEFTSVLNLSIASVVDFVLLFVKPNRSKDEGNCPLKSVRNLQSFATLSDIYNFFPRDNLFARISLPLYIQFMNHLSS